MEACVLEACSPDSHTTLVLRTVHQEDWGPHNSPPPPSTGLEDLAPAGGDLLASPDVQGPGGPGNTAPSLGWETAALVQSGGQVRIRGSVTPAWGSLKPPGGGQQAATAATSQGH